MGMFLFCGSQQIRMEDFNTEISELINKMSSLLEKLDKSNSDKVYELYNIIFKFHSDLSFMLAQFSCDKKDTSSEHLNEILKSDEEDTFNTFKEDVIEESKEDLDFVLPKRDEAQEFNSESVKINIKKQLENQEKKEKKCIHQCSKCHKIFRYKSRLKTHMERCLNKGKKEHRKSSELPNYICSDCGRAYVTKDGLDMHHKIIHQKVTKTIICNQCGKDFFKQGDLNKHLRSHEEKRPCPDCGKMVSRLDLHILTVHTPDELQKYRCQDCDKGFFSMKLLKSHRMNVHLKLRPYKCRFGCDMAYNDGSNRRQHEKRVHGQLGTNKRKDQIIESPNV